MKHCSSSKMSQQQQLLGLEGPVGRQVYYLKLTRIDASATICVYDALLVENDGYVQEHTAFYLPIAP